jgi:hypothetical protein
MLTETEHFPCELGKINQRMQSWKTTPEEPQKL